jgi:uncharacterized membrane protein required for colicin V production
MIGLGVLFWLLVVLFATIGFMRGWAKELMVTVAAILSLFIINVLEGFVPFIRDVLVPAHTPPIFWMRIGIMGALVFFGYQTPNISKLATNNRFAREKLQDILLGTFLGALNGYLLWGTIWYFLVDVGYFPPIITPPAEGTAALEAFNRVYPLLPPVWLGRPVIYFAAALVFAFVIVVMV